MKKLASLAEQTMEVEKYLLWKPEHGVSFVHSHCFVDSCWFWKLFRAISEFSEIGSGKIHLWNTAHLGFGELRREKIVCGFSDDGESYDFWFEQKWLRNDGDPFLWKGRTFFHFSR
jgi:hypothetical protein